jgi:hypothetical protein
MNNIKEMIIKDKPGNRIIRWFNRRTTVRGIKNCLTWFYIIWNDRQWDYGFFFILLEKKLALMEKHWTSTSLCNYVGEATDLENIRKAREACKRLIKDDYWECGDFKEEAKIKQMDLNILFDTIKDHLLCWWD